MNLFDAAVEQADKLQQDTFSVEVTIDGISTRGIYDEEFDEFFGVDGLAKTLEINYSELPRNAKQGSLVKFKESGDSLKIQRILRKDKIYILVLT